MKNTMIKVPFSVPSRTSDDIDLISSAIESGEISGDGPFTKKAQLLLKKQINNSGKVLLTTSCTHALEMAAILLNISSGDEVIVPSFTFVSSALAFQMRGAKIVFADINEKTLNIDESKLENLITQRTRAIVVVHYGGVACEMDALNTISSKYNIDIIEDNAHGLYGYYKDRALGSIGSIAAQSFHGTKNISCGEGGALILNKETFFDRAEIIREKGTNRSRFIRGQVDKYTWVDEGSSYVMSDMLAALLYSQLKFSETIQNSRKRVWETYNRELHKWAQNFNIFTPHIPEYCEHTYHLFYLIFPNKDLRDQFIDFSAEHAIQAVSHYQPLHLSHFVKKTEKHKLDSCPVSTRISECLARLPLYTSMSEDQIDHVIECVQKFSI
tara:strand:+ start:1461 stop:2612 length:1152 start_codon:yes stop_codon:yes gene_type:complete